MPSSTAPRCCSSTSPPRAWTPPRGSPSGRRSAASTQLGTTVFLTTQYLEEADQLCGRLAIIDDGRIVREGTPISLKAELRERQALDDDPTLDDVFLDATGRTRAKAEGAVSEVIA